MKRTILSLCFLSLFLTSAFLLLIYEKKDVFDEDAKKYICIANSGFFYWNSIHEGIKAADRDIGSYTKWIEFDRYDTEEQIRQLEKTKYLDLDGVITVGEPYSEPLKEVLKEISDRGIPIALIDTDSPDSGRDYYIGTNNYEAGRLAAQTIAEQTGGICETLVIVSRLTYANQNERYKGFSDAASEYKNMKVVSVIEAEGDKLTMQEQLAKAFEQFPSVNAIFCAESASARRLGTFLETLQKTDLTIVGFDCSDPTLHFVQDGFYAATIAQSSYDIGYEAVSCLNSWEQGDPPKTVHTDVVCITQENVNDFLSSPKEKK